MRHPPVQEAKNNDAAMIDAANPDAGNDSDSIVATVNDESISDFELSQRVALYLALQGAASPSSSRRSRRPASAARSWKCWKPRSFSFRKR